MLTKDPYGQWYWVPGAIFIIFIIGMVAAAMWSCSSNLVEQPEAEVKPPHSIVELAGNLNVTIWEIDGCQYVTHCNGGIIHLETCPNPMHGK